MNVNTKYSFEKCNDLNLWDDFVDQSKEGSVFCLSLYLENFGGQYQLYLVRKGNQIKAGVICIVENNLELSINDLVIYSGIIFEHNQEQKKTKSLLERFELSEYIIKTLDTIYQKIEMVMAPQVDDIRPFLWHNYHSKEKKDQFTVDIRYTSYLDISSLNFVEDDMQSDLFKNLETLRQRNIRQANNENSYTNVDNQTEVFINYYAQLMQSQGSTQDQKKLDDMLNLINTLIENNLAKMYISYNHNHEIMYITVFAWDQHRAYYLFGAPNPDAKERYKGTVSFWDAFCDLSKNGIKEIDMEGVNSPLRGWFKLSFGGELKTYFRVSKGKLINE